MFYVPFLNEYSERVLPGTDFLASRDKDIEVYRTELYVTSRINRYLNDNAFRNIALGQNYFRLLGLDHMAPQVCANQQPWMREIQLGGGIVKLISVWERTPF